MVEPGPSVSLGSPSLGRLGGDGLFSFPASASAFDFDLYLIGGGGRSASSSSESDVSSITSAGLTRKAGLEDFAARERILARSAMSPEKVDISLTSASIDLCLPFPLLVVVVEAAVLVMIGSSIEVIAVILEGCAGLVTPKLLMEDDTEG